MEMSHHYIVAYRWNDKDYSIRATSLAKAVSIQYQLEKEGKQPAIHENETPEQEIVRRFDSVKFN